MNITSPPGLLFSFMVGLPFIPVFASQPSVQPNVILIVADDMGIGDLGAINNGKSKTPNLDQMKADGVWFPQAYSGSTVCAPARASLLTGLYPHRTGCVTLSMERFPEFSRMHSSMPTMADVFRANGYITGLVGKWHAGIGEGYEPLQRGFDEFEGFFGLDIPDYFNYTLRVQDSLLRVDDKYLTHDLSERAIDFVKRHQKSPFFLHLAHYAPHRPLGAPAETISRYQDKGMDKNTAIVYAMIEEMDKGIGELFDVLTELGLMENTIVIFTSDNGPDPLIGRRDNNNLKGSKYTVYEGGIHVPFVWLQQGFLASATVDELIHFTDVLPTLMAVCNLQFDLGYQPDGVDFSPLLYNEPVQMPRYRYWQWNRGVPEYSHNAAIRFGPWKVVKPYIDHWELMPEVSEEEPVMYNMYNDPGETTDVSEQNQRLFDELRVRLEHWSRSVEMDRLQNTE
jgi:arylsulfatase A